MKSHPNVCTSLPSSPLCAAAGAGESKIRRWELLEGPPPPNHRPHPPANSSRNLILKGERAAKPGPAMSCPQIQLAALGVTLDWPFSTSVSRFAGSRFFILVILKSIKWFLKKKKKKRHLNKSKKRKDDCSDTLTKFYHPFILLAKIYRMLPHVRCWDYSCKWS